MRFNEQHRFLNLDELGVPEKDGKLTWIKIDIDTKEDFLLFEKIDKANQDFVERRANLTRYLLNDWKALNEKVFKEQSIFYRWRWSLRNHPKMPDFPEPLEGAEWEYRIPFITDGVYEAENAMYSNHNSTKATIRLDNKSKIRKVEKEGA